MEHLKKKGRPAKIGIKRKKISVRVEGTDVEKLDFLVNEKGMTYTEVFKEGLKMTYNLKRVLGIIVGQKIKTELLSDKNT